MIAVVVTIAACKKGPSEGGAESAGTSGSAAGSGAGSNLAGPGSNLAGPGSNLAGPGSNLAGAGSTVAGAGSNLAGAGSTVAGAGSNMVKAVPDGSAAGSAADVGAGSAAAGAGMAGMGAADASYNKAAFLADPLCREVADRIRACVDKPEFIAALDEGATAADKKVNARLRKAVPKWQKSSELCGNTWDIINYEYTGFLDSPGAFKAPNVLATCASLGGAVKAAGGLVGGETAE